MTKREKINLARELYLINSALNALNDELIRRIEKVRRSDKRCVNCGGDMTEQEISESDTCNKCYSTLQTERHNDRNPDELDFYRGGK